MKKFNSILLIDDDKASNYLAKVIISDIGITAPLEVSTNGKEALDYLEACCANGEDGFPDLILLDINMPVMDGFEFLEKSQYLPCMQKHRPLIIILTSSQYHSDIERARSYQINHYISKPLTEEQLREIFEVSVS